MNKTLAIALALGMPLGAASQTAIDAMSISGNDLRGTARFMSMGGAFTALGGDMSTLTQNPGGIGVYRSSDINLTLDLSATSAKSMADYGVDKQSKTTFGVNNFGYIGSVYTGNSTMPFFNWGVSYSRKASFNRNYGGYLGQLGTSYSNFVADYTTADGFTPGQLDDNTQGYNPYFSTEVAAPWSSILLFNSYVINPVSPGSSTYTGLYNYAGDGVPGSSARGWYGIEEKGHVDEYNIDFGGNVEDVFYWGVGFGITDLDFKQYAYYGEDLTNANVPDADAKSYVSGGEASYSLDNVKHIWGSGFNFKAGFIVKPINELRIGMAVHTPTYYNLSQEAHAVTNFVYNSDTYADGQAYNSSRDTEWDDFDWKFRSPWRLMFGAAGVIEGRLILSADYEYRAYSDMKIQDWEGYDYTALNEDVKTWYKSSNIVRLGAEYRVTPALSVRAGYSFESTPVKSKIIDPYENEVNYIYTSGPDDTETQPSFTFDRSTSYITLGLGYRYKNFYADLAYLHRSQKGVYHAFTDYVDIDHYKVSAPTANLSRNTNSVVLTLGMRF